jgi:hypothetical protein
MTNRGNTKQCKDQKNERQKLVNVHKTSHIKLKVDNYKPH